MTHDPYLPPGTVSRDLEVAFGGLMQCEFGHSFYLKDGEGCPRCQAIEEREEGDSD